MNDLIYEPKTKSRLVFIVSALGVLVVIMTVVYYVQRGQYLSR